MKLLFITLFLFFVVAFTSGCCFLKTSNKPPETPKAVVEVVKVVKVVKIVSLKKDCSIWRIPSDKRKDRFDYIGKGEKVSVTQEPDGEWSVIEIPQAYGDVTQGYLRKQCI